MNERLTQITENDDFLKKIDAEVTLVLQNLQWDRQRILKGCEMVTCLYDKGHSIPARQKAEHEANCLLRSQGYTSEDKLLPDPPDVSNVVRFDESEITQIIENAARNHPHFRKGAGIQGPQQPLSVDRLQWTFTSDERRAIHDAVVAAAPAHDSPELDLKMPSGADKGTGIANRTKSHAELLAELRDMKRRRTKYRVVTNTKNYSDTLRDVIRTQMELYSEVTAIKSEPDDNVPETTKPESNSNVDNYNMPERDRYRYPTPSQTRRSQYEHTERDRSRSRFNEMDRDTRYSKNSIKCIDRPSSSNSEIAQDREIKKERNENEIDYKTDRDGIYNNERNRGYSKERRERDRSKSKYNSKERTDKYTNKYSSTSKYKDYNNEKEKYRNCSNDEEKSRHNKKYRNDKDKASMRDRDSRCSKDRDRKRY